jgi:hypothetical protein
MTSDEFHASVLKFFRQNQSLAYVIYSNPTADVDRQIAARAQWLDYLESKNLTGTAKTFKAIWNGGGKAITVPTEDPTIFDLSYNGSRTAYGARRQEKSTVTPRAYRED